MSRILVITGMHRSGTSLFAGWFERAGVDLGPRQLAPRPDNPFGYFEDVDFVEFHEDVLHARGQNILVPRDLTVELTPNERARAQALVAARAGRALWGWKDPRTSLLLDLWGELVPDAQFLLLYRHPFDVALSLARRGEVVGFDFRAAFEAWAAYNAALLRFLSAHPDRALLCSSYAALAEPEAFATALSSHLGLALALTAASRDEVYRAGLLRRAPRTASGDALLRQIDPATMTLYDGLQARAALPEPVALVPAPPSLDALAQFAAACALDGAAERHALMQLLVAIADPSLYESFAREHVERTNELEAQRRAWEAAAVARARALDEQTAWAQPRLRDLEAMERSALVRALRRLGWHR